MKSELYAAKKLHVYRTIYRLNLSFSKIVTHCQTLEQAGALTPKFAHLFQSFTRELQGEVNAEILEPLHSAELDDWRRYGKARQKWEKYLRGPEAKPPRKARRRQTRKRNATRSSSS
jgi:hypothetical protein